MKRLALLCLFWLVGPEVNAQFLPAHELYSKLNGSELALRVYAHNQLPTVSLEVHYNDPTMAPGERFASINIPRDALNLMKMISGETRVKVRLPGCNLWHELKASYRLDDDILSVKTQINETDLWNQDCKAALKDGAWKIEVAFPRWTSDDRIKFGLLPSPNLAKDCDVVSGRDHPLDSLIGTTLTVFPNGWAHDADVFRVNTKLFTDLQINSLAEVGPGNWQIKDYDVFALGDRVQVTKLLKAPRPGGYGAVRGYIVEVVRQRDGKTAAVDLDQLISGDVAKCSPLQLIGPSRRVGGVFVRLKAGARPVVDVTRSWVTDPLIHYGFCQDFLDGRYQCQTREYPKADLHIDSWSAQYDEVEILTALP